MQISHAEFARLCDRQARAYAEWRDTPTRATEQAMHQAIAAVREALRPKTADV